MSKSDYAIEVVKGTKYFVRLVSIANGQTVMVGETYLTKFNAKRAGKRLADSNGFEYREVFNG